MPFTPLEKIGLISFLLDQIVSPGKKKCVEQWGEHLHDNVAPLNLLKKLINYQIKYWILGAFFFFFF